MLIQVVWIVVQRVQRGRLILLVLIFWLLLDFLVCGLSLCELPKLVILIYWSSGIYRVT